MEVTSENTKTYILTLTCFSLLDLTSVRLYMNSLSLNLPEGNKFRKS